MPAHITILFPFADTADLSQYAPYPDFWSTTGAAIPIAALFDWLKGENTRLNGWSADLSGLDTGRIVATRTEPAPQTRLRIVLDQ